VSNFELLRVFIENENVDIIFLQECWRVNDKIKLRLNGYNGPYLASRTNKQGGGTGIYFKTGLNGKIFYPTFRQDIIEPIGIEVATDNGIMKIINVYRPPKTFETDDLMDLFNANNSINTVFTGDFNVNFNGLNLKTLEYKAQLREFGLVNLIKTTTRLCSNTCIDHLLVNKLSKIDIKSNVMNEAISDH
jgi:exonuclease III